jgi:hypothetical protein
MNIIPLLRRSLALLAVVTFPLVAIAQENSTADGKNLYDQIKSVSLSGSSVSVKGLVLERDRAQMTFDGTFYFGLPANGHITTAVFIGAGQFKAPVPPSAFEQANVKRLLGADAVESDFKTAVLRFGDDSLRDISPGAAQVGTADAQIQKIASEAEARILKQTGANLSARITISLINQETPGFFFASFDGGRRGRFNFLLDYQNRIPVANFDLNGGEKGIIFTYNSGDDENEVWMAFYGLEDYKRRSVSYSDVNDQIDIKSYDMDVDLREHKKYLRLSSRIEAETVSAKLRAISFSIGENLGAFESWRLKKQMRLQQARVNATEIPFVQEDWEGGFTVFLPAEISTGQKLDFNFLLQGDFMYDAETPDCHYPRSNESWYPRHGYLDRATFNLTFRHPKRLHIASVGERLSEELDVEDKGSVVSKYRMNHPVALVTFALAPFERHSQMVKWDKGGVGDPIRVEFNSLPGGLAAIKEDFILAELDNSLRYFTALFGKYPYPVFSAAFHPFPFGQGFPSLLMIPGVDRASKQTYVFIAHETAHQWWGDIVTWRSYRDQWLSEGFAEYSGILYTGLRSGAGDRQDLIGRLRDSLKVPPQTETGVGKGRLVDVGPIILGHRLSTRKTQGAYVTLIYNKGALVLRMIHFLLTDPGSGEGQEFFNMMTDFVNRHRDQFASTDDFRIVANEHFAKSPIARKYGLKDLDWFFKQWVYQTELPSYRLEYQIQDQPEGVVLTATVFQEHVPDDWLMVLPLALSFGGNREAHGTVHALGPKTTVQIKLPMRPTKVELDPLRWVLSDSTSTKQTN